VRLRPPQHLQVLTAHVEIENNIEAKLKAVYLSLVSSVYFQALSKRDLSGQRAPPYKVPARSGAGARPQCSSAS
jgi:hypothetical protein